MDQTTIAAIATPIGVGGIGVIRVSGPDAFTVASNIFVPKNTKIAVDNCIKIVDTSLVQSHKLYYGWIIYPDKGGIVDEVLVTFMKAPNTYTTENVVEIQAHSGFVTLNCILSIVLENGAIVAEPGEFTKRAFLNGRIDLTQAESTIDLINAKTNKAAILAARCLEGSIRTVLVELKLVMGKIQANYEAVIEFAEQSEEMLFEDSDYKIIKGQIIPKLESVLKKERDRVLYRDGTVVAIVGAPNVGKSSLMNRLLRDDRAIVADLPGTTRDVIKEHIIINRLPVIVQDTAGIRIPRSAIEQLGINKSLRVAEKSDIVVLVLDACRQPSIAEKEILERYKNKKLLLVINKIDICSRESLLKLEQMFAGYRVIRTSAKQNLFIDELEMGIFDVSISCEQRDTSIDTTSLNLRQYRLLTKTMKMLKELLVLINEKTPVDILSDQMGKCMNTLGEISGDGENIDLYEHIFSRFCVGK